MYASNYFESVIINLMRGTTFTAPANLYVGLFLSNPSDTGTGGTEVSYSGYARQKVTFQLDGSASIQNSNTITFPESKTSISSPVSHIGIYDSLTGTSGSSTHLWLYGELVTKLQIQPNVSPIIRPGAIKWTMNGNMSDTYKQQILNTLRKQVNSLAPFSPYIGLCNGDPANGGTEFNGNAYARIPVTFSNPAADTASATALMTKNSANIVSPNPATGYWGVLNYAGIYNAKSGGALFASVPLSNSYTMNEGSVAGFKAGQLTFSVN